MFVTLIFSNCNEITSRDKTFCNSLIFGANIKSVTNLIQVTVTKYTTSDHKTEAFYTDVL
jgi:hypothetical protein